MSSTGLPLEVVIWTRPPNSLSSWPSSWSFTLSLARFNQPGDSILLTEAVIYGSGTENVVCHLMLFLEPESLAKLLDALEAGNASSLGGA